MSTNTAATETNKAETAVSYAALILADEGIDITLTNWRGIIAPGGITDAERTALVDLATQLHEQDAWAEQLSTKGWTDAFIAGDEFDAFLADDIALTQETLRTIGLIE